MTVALIGCASILVFVLLFRFVGLLVVAQRAVATARSAVDVMKDRSLDDDAKEKAVQKASLGLFRDFGGILVRSAVILAGAAAPAYLAEFAGLTTAQTVFDWLLRWDVILIASLVSVAILFGLHRLRGA
ncbi:MAG: hypothetical protein AAF401_05470 [Pseudomonadota bacterium]